MTPHILLKKFFMSMENINMIFPFICKIGQSDLIEIFDIQSHLEQSVTT